MQGFFLFIFMNNILDSAKNFSRLLDVEYEIILAKKGNQVRLIISFEKIHFYHLAGLQYLTDIHELDNQREIVFDWILSESIKNERIESSQFYPKSKTVFTISPSLNQFLTAMTRFSNMTKKKIS